MGTRRMDIAPELLVKFLQSHDGDERTYWVKNPLPDDARVIRVEQNPIYAFRNLPTICLVLESTEWPDDLEEYLQPSLTVRYVSKEEGSDSC